jgi:hypothetical protein
MVVLLTVPSFETLASLVIIGEAVKLIPDIFAPLTLTDWPGGVKTYPAWLGVTV